MLPNSILVQQAFEYAQRHGPPTAYDLTQGMPPASLTVFLLSVTVPGQFANEVSAEIQARTMRRQYDPDQTSPWVFIPNPNADGVWLIRPKQG